MSFFQSLLPIFTTTLLPVFLVAMAGYVLSIFVPIEGRTIGRLLFYLATPSLVFRSLYTMEIDVTALQHVATVTIGVLAITLGLGWLLTGGQERRTRSALILTGAIGNMGNMGLPITLFAFGEPGLALATVIYAITSFVSNTIGVMVASAGSTPLAKAALHSLRAPVLYAALLGLLLNRLQIDVPDPLFKSIDLLSGAAIPGMLVLLGAQLRSTQVSRVQFVMWRSVVVRLVAAPLVTLALCALLIISGLERQVLVLQAGMPTAVMTTVLATEFDTAPHLVAAVVLVSTLLSMGSLSIILWMIT